MEVKIKKRNITLVILEKLSHIKPSIDMSNFDLEEPLTSTARPRKYAHLVFQESETVNIINILTDLYIN